MKIRTNHATYSPGGQLRESSNEINAVSACSSLSSSSSSSLASFHPNNQICEEPSVLLSSIEELSDDITDVLDFHFELFEIDNFMEEEDEKGMIDASNFFLVDDDEASSKKSSDVRRRRSILALMSHNSAPHQLTDQSREDVSVELTMEKLDECMRKTADSRVRLLKLIDGRYIDHEDVGNAEDSSMILPRRVSISLQCQGSIQKRKEQPRISKDGRRAIKGRSTTTKGHRKNTSSSEYACSGVLLKRLEPSVAESMISHLSVPTNLGCSAVTLRRIGNHATLRHSCDKERISYFLANC